jgi:uncharacterized protein (DUF1499 family)
MQGNREKMMEAAEPAPPPPVGTKRSLAATLTRIAVVLSLGAVVFSLIAAFGSGQELWHFSGAFGVLRYSFYAAIAAALLGIVAAILARRSGERGLLAANIVAILVALGFIIYLGLQVSTARSVPAIHDVTTNLDDMPEFTRLQVRTDNLEKVPAMGKPELAALEPEARWKAIHREAYDDLEPLQVPWDVAETIRRAEALARKRGWEVAKVDTAAGILEATATTFFFRFKDDVAVRARPHPQGQGSVVDMRSISRVGGSDVGVNAKRIRSFLEDLKKG